MKTPPTYVRDAEGRFQNELSLKCYVPIPCLWIIESLALAGNDQRDVPGPTASRIVH
jgi:hypothetical protein